jgi:hypothetical protein
MRHLGRADSLQFDVIDVIDGSGGHALQRIPLQSAL